jgi:hypothetical protein
LFLFMNKQQPPDHNNIDHLLSKDNNASVGNSSTCLFRVFVFFLRINFVLF